MTHIGLTDPRLHPGAPVLERTTRRAQPVIHRTPIRITMARVLSSLRSGPTPSQRALDGITGVHDLHR